MQPFHHAPGVHMADRGHARVVRPRGRPGGDQPAGGRPSGGSGAADRVGDAGGLAGRVGLMDGNMRDDRTASSAGFGLSRLLEISCFLTTVPNSLAIPIGHSLCDCLTTE